MRILIVDDEPELLRQLGRVFVEQHYTVDTAADGEAALEKIFTTPYDLILLDVMLPEADGLAVLREIRREKIGTPVLMLTAKAELDDRISGLDLGADDYLTKPFSVAELLARSRALLRRATEHGAAILQAGALRLDTISRRVNRDGVPVVLTPKEFSILEFLLYNRNRVISRFDLAEHVWGDAFDPFSMSNSIDVHVKNLRKKIGDAGGIIETVRGIGYVIRSVAP